MNAGKGHRVPQINAPSSPVNSDPEPGRASEVVERFSARGVVRARRLLPDGHGALGERLPVAALGPGNGRSVFCVVLAVFLAGRGDVLLGYRRLTSALRSAGWSTLL